MEARNLDFNVPVTRDQWEQLGRTAAALSPDGSGFRWKEGEPEQIHVSIRDEDAPNFWRRFVTEEHTDGAHDREVARFVFNGGRPYAELLPPRVPDEPAITDQQEQAMQTELEQWTRNKWHDLLKESGLHFDRGHVPYE